MSMKHHSTLGLACVHARWIFSRVICACRLLNLCQSRHSRLASAQTLRNHLQHPTTVPSYIKFHQRRLGGDNSEKHAGLYRCAISAHRAFSCDPQDGIRKEISSGRSHPCCASTVVTESTMATMSRKTILRSAEIMVATLAFPKMLEAVSAVRALSKDL